MEIAAFKVKSRNLPVLTFGYSDLNIWSYRSPIDANSIFFGFLTPRSINAPHFSQKWCHMRAIWFFKDYNWILPANRFREETSPNYVPKHLNRHEETSPNYVPKHLNRHPSFYFSNLTPLSQNLKISCKAISHFLRK